MHRRRLLPAALIVWVLLLSCNAPVAVAPSGGATPTVLPDIPSDALPTPPPEAVFTPVAEVTVGAEGGTLQGGGLALSVPPGALQADAALMLSVAEEPPLGEQAVSPVYRVEGLPAELRLPLTVRVQAEGPLSGDCYIAAGTPEFNLTAGFTTTVFAVFPATVTGDMLETTLDVSPGPVGRGGHLAAPAAQQTDVQFILELYGLKDYWTYQSKHFVLAYPQSLHTHMPSLQGYLERAFDVIQELGFEFPQPWRTMPVAVMDFGRDAGDIARYGTVKIGQRRVPLLTIEKDYVSEEQLSLLPAAIGRAFFLAIADYNAGGRIEDPDQLWLHIAAASWVEEQFVDNPQAYRPALFAGHELAPLRGLRDGAGNDRVQAWAHGCGMAAMIKYHVDRLKPEILVDTYNRLRDGSSATEALLAAIGIPPSAWLPLFFRDYVGGKVYGVYPGTFLHVGEGVVTVDAEYGTRTEYPARLPDLSAKVYLITVEQTDKDVRLDLRAGSDETAASDVNVVVFKRQGGTLTPLGAGPSVSVPAADAAGELVAVLVNSTLNPPTYNARINAVLKLNYFGWGTNFKEASIGLENVAGRALGPYSGPDGYPYYPETFTCHDGDGIFSGEEFKCSWTYESATGRDFGTVKVTLAFSVDDPLKTKVAHFEASRFWDTGTRKGSTIIAGNDVPFGWAMEEPEGGFAWTFLAHGQDACDRLSPPLTFEWTGYGGDDVGDWGRLQKYTCVPESTLRIELKEPKP